MGFEPTISTVTGWHSYALVEGVDRITHGLVVAAQRPRDRQWRLPAGAGAQDLAAPQHKGIAGP